MFEILQNIAESSMIFMVYYVIKGKQKIKTASGDHVVETKWRRLGDIVKCTETFCAGPAGGNSAHLEAQIFFFRAHGASAPLPRVHCTL